MSDPKPSRKQKQREFKSQPTLNGAERLKTVVRRLPPNLPEDVFWQSVQAWVSDDTITWKSYFPGKFRTKRANKEGIPSRAYIAFKNEDQVATFSREYDGHLFRDKAGNESQAIVEFAPFQKIPSDKKKNDARNNTIDKDDDYLSFLESLKHGSKPDVSLEALVTASQLPPAPTTTPLLEALKAEKSAQKDKEAILRNHAHYKDTGLTGTSLKKEDTKKKLAVSPPDPTPSKKAKKEKTAAGAKAQTEVGTGKTQQPVGPGAAPSTAKPQPPIARQRPGRTHPGKGDTTIVPTPSGSGSTPGTSLSVGVTSNPPPTKSFPASSAPPTSEPTPTPAPARKNRPVFGLGRQFEAALNGAGVAVSPAPVGDRKKRDKADAGKQTLREGSSVPSILQRSEMGSDVVIMQRPHSPRVDGAGSGDGAAGGPSGAAPRGGRRGRGRGRGRGG